MVSGWGLGFRLQVYDWDSLGGRGVNTENLRC